MTYESIPALLAAKPELKKVREWDERKDKDFILNGAFGVKFVRETTADAAILEVANAVGTCTEDLAERISADGLCVGITDETPCSEDDSDCCLVCWTEYLNRRSQP